MVKPQRFYPLHMPSMRNLLLAFLCQLKALQGTQTYNHPLSDDVLGIVATLGTVDDDNLSRGTLKLPENYVDIESRIKDMRWKKEIISEDMHREQALLEHAWYNLFS